LSCIFIFACLLLARQQVMCWRNSIELFKQAIVVNPRNAHAHDLLGAVLSGDGKQDEAIEHYEQAVRVKPNDVEFQYHLGRELIKAGRFGEAETHLAEALKQMPDNPILHNSLGTALGQEGKVAEAIQEFNRAIQIQPDYPKPYFNLGKFEQQLGHDDAAATNFSKAVQLDPDWPEALDNLALLLVNSSEAKLLNPAQALKLSLHANEITSNRSPFFLKTLARAYAAGGDFSNAVSTAGLALEIATTNQLKSLTGQITAELKAYQSEHVPAKSMAEAVSSKSQSHPQN
jgi:Flp pilus assembly protein TadD